jgi:IS5 family transposase
MARRSAADNDLQSLQSLVSASCLAAHLGEDGGRRPHSRRAFHRQQPRQSASLGKRLKKGEFEEAIGRARGGRKSKIHALADDRGRPVAFALTPGNVADVVMAVPLLGAVAKPKRLLADKAYDADSLRRWLKHRGIRAAIPSTASRRTPYPLDRAAYKRHRTVILQAEELATPRNPIQPSGAKLSLRPRSRRHSHRMDLIESPT